MSPGIKGNAPDRKAWLNWIPVEILNQTTPKEYRITIPPKVLAIAKEISLLPLPFNKLMVITLARKPIKKPPVGPRRTLIPEVPPAKTGTPIIPKKRKVKTLSVACLLVRMLPASIMAKLCPVTGTGEKGKGIDT